MPTDVIARRLVIHGRVQGVFFRDSLRRAALAAGVDGWARNREDGAVEALLEGTPESVEKTIEFCRHGPPHARVERVDIHEEPPSGASGFRIS